MEAGIAQIKLMADITDLVGKMKQAQSLSNQAATGIKNAFGGLGTQLAGALSVGSVIAYFKAIEDGLDRFNDLSDATGATVENISRLEDISLRTGHSFETTSAALMKLNQSLLMAKPGSDAEIAIKALGLSIADLKAMDPVEAFNAIAKSMNGYAQDAGLARVAQALFGKGLAEIAPLLKDVADKGLGNATVTAQQAEEAAKLNKQLTDWNKNMDDLSRSIVSDVLPALNKFIAKQKEARAAVPGVFGKGWEGYKAWVGDFWSSGWNDYTEWVKNFYGINQGIGSRMASGTVDYGNQGTTSSSIPSSIGDPFAAAAAAAAARKAADDRAKAEQDAAMAIAKARQEARRQEEMSLQQFELEQMQQGNALAKAAKDRVQAIVDATPAGKLEKDRQDMILLANAYQEFIDTNGRAGISEQQYLEAVGARLNSTEEKIVEITKQSDQMQYVFTNAFKGMEDILVAFATTGKMSFSGMIDSFIADLLRYQIQQSITLPLMGMLSGGGAGLMGLLGITRAGSNPAGYAGTLNNPSAFVAPSYAGGGYTGFGARTGGLDGMGGFPAILHPNETVIDHSQSSGRGAGQQITINIASPVIGNVASKDDVIAGMQVVKTQIYGQLARQNRYGGGS